MISTDRGWRKENKIQSRSAFEVENIAMKEAIEIVIDRGWKKIILEGDCKNLIEVLNGVPKKAE